MSFRLSALIGALLLAASVAGHAQNLAIVLPTAFFASALAF